MVVAPFQMTDLYLRFKKLNGVSKMWLYSFYGLKMFLFVCFVILFTIFYTVILLILVLFIYMHCYSVLQSSGDRFGDRKSVV